MFNDCCAGQLQLCPNMCVVAKGRTHPAHVVLVLCGLWWYGHWEGDSMKVLSGLWAVVSCPCSLGCRDGSGWHRAAFTLCLTSALAAMCISVTNEMTFVSYVGKWSTVPFDLTSPRFEVGSEQIFFHLAFIRSSRHRPKEKTLTFWGSVSCSAAPPADPTSLCRSSLAAAACCRSCAGQEAAGRSASVPQWWQSCLW